MRMDGQQITGVKQPFISIIIPVERETPYLTEALEHYKNQRYRKFELIIASSYPIKANLSFVHCVINPWLKGDVSSKRNTILKYGSGSIFVFNDDDVFVPANYLQNVARIFTHADILMAAGPLLTPPADTVMQQASGAVLESYLGSLGAGIYRNRIAPARVVYDFPAANLVMRSDVFKKLGGFKPGLYPGEDTKLCLDLFNRYRKGLHYDPRLFVYHHRKALFRGHLRQIGRYGKQRGWFAISYPETSFTPYYFFPTLLLLYTAVVVPLSIGMFIFLHRLYIVLLLPLAIYVLFAIVEGVIVNQRRGVRIGILVIPGIFGTHYWYGWKFLVSFIAKLLERPMGFMRLMMHSNEQRNKRTN